MERKLTPPIEVPCQRTPKTVTPLFFLIHVRKALTPQRLPLRPFQSQPFDFLRVAQSECLSEGSQQY